MVTLFFALAAAAVEIPPGHWVELRKDPAGARPGSAIRYAPDAGVFLLWGFMNDNPGLLQEHPLMEIPEYDMVAFDPTEGRWRDHLPPGVKARPRFAYVPRTYSGLTTGSERTVLRGPTEERGGVPRPDLNLVFDEVAYDPPSKSLVYFTGGLTAAYDVARRRWRDLAPAQSPPPVVGGSLAYDPVNDQMILFGGGHVAERAPDGRVAGFTGTWIYNRRDNQWRQWPLVSLPPPRMNSRMVTDTKNQVLVVFGGDAQSHYLGDTWIFDLKRLEWRASKASGPEARAGHFTVYDPETASVIIGGGYNQKDLTDMWAYDVREDRWQRLRGEVPTGFYLTADIAPEKRMIVLVTSSRKPGDKMSCNILHPVRTTFAYVLGGQRAEAAGRGDGTPIPKRAPAPSRGRTGAERVLFVNQWVALGGAEDAAPVRTWGSATLDAARGQILYWGGGHCGYEGNDVSSYDIESQSWRAPSPRPEFPERTWNHGVRLAGVTFQGGPWTDHGRKIYAHDPVSRKMIVVRPIRLTAGYEPEALRVFPSRLTGAPDALVAPSSYTKYATSSYDPETGRWELLGSAPEGLDTLVTTRHGVMGVNVDWPSRLNDAGYQLPVSSSRDTAVYQFDAARRAWKRLGEPQPSPQNLYEMTGLAYDSTRDQLILHGGGSKRDELWTFDLGTRRWRHLQPKGPSPACTREAVYIPGQDVFLIYGSELWAYKPGENTWRRLDVAPITSRASQNRAMVYEAARDLVLVVLGAAGDAGQARVYGLRYRHASARFLDP